MDPNGKVGHGKATDLGREVASAESERLRVLLSIAAEQDILPEPAG